MRGRRAVGRSVQRCVAALALVPLAALVACGRSERLERAPAERTPEGPERRGGPVGELPEAVDAAAVIVPVDPAPPAGDLRAELDGFTTLEACVAQHAALDPLVGDAIRAIGYETFLRDACRMLAAAKSHDAKGCAALDAEGLRMRCRTMVAMASGDPALCPWAIPDDPAHGRATTCVAAVTGDARLCVAVERAAKATCEALAWRDARRCGEATNEAENASCRREALRFARVLEAAPVKGSALVTGGEMRLRALDGTPKPPLDAASLALEAEHGVVVRTDLLGTLRFDVGEVRELGVTTRVNGPTSRPRMALTVAVDATGARVERLEVDVPGSRTMVVPGDRWDGLLKLPTLDRARGGKVDLEVHGTLGVPPQAYAVDAHVTTFVRDRVDDARERGLPGRLERPPGAPKAKGR